MADDVLLKKVAIIERCLKRVEEEYRGHEQELVTNCTRQDAIVLNLLRASEPAIDLAMHLVRVKRLGLPPVEGRKKPVLSDRYLEGRAGRTQETLHEASRRALRTNWRALRLCAATGASVVKRDRVVT